MLTNEERANKIKLGFSTNCLYKSGLKEDECLDFFRALGFKTVEFGSIRLREFLLSIPSIRNYDLRGFEYISLHSPKINYGWNDDTRKVFEEIRALHCRRPLDLVIFHPDTVEDFGIFKSKMWPQGLEFAFENMDNRKGSYKNLENMKKLYTYILSGFRMVLDVNHVFSNDPTMRLADDFKKFFGNEIIQTHLSGYRDGHVPLFETKQEEIIRAVQGISAPIIVESVLDPDRVVCERDYILDVLGK